MACVINGDLREITPAKPYTSADLNWQDKKSRSSAEMKDASCRPEMAEAVDASGYDTVFVGFPIWWYEAPRIIATFLESQDFSDKTLIPFATSGGSGMGNTDSILRRLAPAANWKQGKRLSAAASADELATWVKGLSL